MNSTEQPIWLLPTFPTWQVAELNWPRVVLKVTVPDGGVVPPFV